jgi:GntR family transcriptional regulator/MocR family aminotransferase
MLVRLDGSGPLYVQLYRALRTDILSGRLAPGARLPSTRALAAETGVARNTVLLCFEQLLAEGYAVGRRGAGTYVAAELPRDMEFAARSRTAAAPARAGTPHLSSYGRRIVADRSRVPGWTSSRNPIPYDFRYGRPAFADFPHAIWRRLLARRARAASAADLDYGAPAGPPALREVIAEYAQRSRGVVCTPAQIVITHGSQQALDLVARVMLDAGDGVVLEDPHYAGARRVFAAAGAALITVPVDAEGLDIGAVDARDGVRRTAKRTGAAAPRVRLVYVTPSHQFPTGAIMSLARRLALLAWAQRVGAHVLEDDYDSEYRYAGRPIEALQGLDRHGRVIYAGTFSKLMFPALRLGYVVLAERLVPPFLTAKALATLGGATLEQMALADFIREGHFERHVRRCRARNAARRAVLLAAIAEYLGDRVEVSGANAGVHLLLWLPGMRPDRVDALITRAHAAGVGVYSVAPFYHKPPKRAGLLLGYASLSEEDIRRGIRRLAAVFG